jgi:hypothetical protein
MLSRIVKIVWCVLMSFFLLGSLCPKDERADEDFMLITPFVAMSDMGPVMEAFSTNGGCPWGFEHRGIDFFSAAALAPFRAVCPGEIKEVNLWANDKTGNWQVNVSLEYNSTFSVGYAFEPLTNQSADGQTQRDNISVSIGQEVQQGDLIGNLFFGANGTHVHFGVRKNNDDICPEPYFIQAARDSIMQLIHLQWPGADMCYE